MSICGHKHILNFLKTSLENNRLSHSYLFYGPAGLGKDLTARWFINLLLCEKQCGACLHCRQLEQNIHPDVFIVQRQAEKKNIAVEQIRDLRQKLTQRSFFDNFKVALIENAETLNIEAHNALLKTLEETTPKTIIILIANQISGIPQTILSRSQKIKFLPVPLDILSDWLEKKFTNLSQKEIQEIAHLSQGKPGRALFIIENENNGAREEIEEMIDFFEITLQERFQLVADIAGKSKFVESQEKVGKVLDSCLNIIRDLMLFRADLEQYSTNIFLRERIKKISGYYSEQQILEFAQKIKEAQTALRLNATPRLVLENLVLSL